MTKHDQEPQLDTRTIPTIVPRENIGRPAGTDAPLGRHLHRRVARLVDVLELDDNQCTPELRTAVKAAYAGTYKLHGKHDGLQHEVIEESVLSALESYSRCACGNIWVTCPPCGGGESKKFILPFDLEGLRKLTLRFVDRVLRRAKRRTLTPEQRGVVEDSGDRDVLDGDISVTAGRANWTAAQRVENDMVAQIDAGRGVIDWHNTRLRRFLASVFTPRELTSIRPYPEARALGRLKGEMLARLRERWTTFIYSR
jgi:hypothetical protein